MIDPDAAMAAISLVVLLLYGGVCLIDAIWGKGRPREPHNP